MTSSLTRAHVSVAVRRGDDASVLIRRDGSLPGFESSINEPWQVVAPIEQAMAGLGLEVTTLRAARVNEAGDDRLYEVMLRSGRPPAGSGWRPFDALEPQLREALAPVSGELQPWDLPGWLDDMVAWLEPGSSPRPSGPSRRTCRPCCDPSPSQVIVGEMGPVIFDWSDASITHPFLSLASFLAGAAVAGWTRPC